MQRLAQNRVFTLSNKKVCLIGKLLLEMRLTVPYLDWENFVLDAIAQYCFVDGIYGLNSWLLCKIIIKNIVKIHVNGILFF